MEPITIIENIADANAKIHSLKKETKAQQDKIVALETQLKASQKEIASLKAGATQAAERPVVMGQPNGNMPIDELYAAQAELPTWQERQAFFDAHIAPKVQAEIDRIKR